MSVQAQLEFCPKTFSKRNQFSRVFGRVKKFGVF